MTHLLTLDPGDIANRTHDTTEPGTPLRSTWVLGWRELRQLVVLTAPRFRHREEEPDDVVYLF